tara:strand:- start:97 stop:957 length:861 start_codon:yes stop_codon:yes gene_type:complete
MKDQLIDQGYCVLKNVLNQTSLEQIRKLCGVILKGLPKQHRDRNRSQGSLVLIADYPEFASLIAHPGIVEAFNTFEFMDPRFSSGYIISKPSLSPALFWHQDWWGWDDPVSYTEFIAQTFFMIYLTDTETKNGCLRVIPGSHRTSHPIHDAPAAHNEALAKVVDPTNFLYHSQPEEIPVPVKAGDLVVGDARLLHGTYPNNSEQERTVITLWYHPDFGGLPEGMQARIMEIFHRRGVDTDLGSEDSRNPDDWSDSQRDMIAPYLPNYRGVTSPHEWNRIPSWNSNG